MRGRWRGRIGGLTGGRCGGRECGCSGGRGVSCWEGNGGFWGEGYYSVSFFEELIVGGGAGERVLVAVSVVSVEELVEGGGYVGHCRIDGIVRAVFWKKVDKGPDQSKGMVRM